MKYAVIYARYSSDRQNEMSIDGQIAECRRYAEAHNMVIVQEYIDKAQSATTDRRPEFLRMISDSEEKAFEIILVYQLDRFARNKDDSGYYKKILRENGVKVVSAMEQIATDSSGVITEGMLEIVADWYSKQLSEKVTRGMYQRAEQKKYNGGTMTFGYAADENGNYIIDEPRAKVVKELFERVNEGETVKDIMDDFNNRGIRTRKGTLFGKNSMQHILRNEKYKGIYIYGDTHIEDGIPRIVSDELFDNVQKIIGGKKRGHRPAIEDYLLTGKLYCGYCKTQMVGTSGTSKSGRTYRYYMCMKKGCKKKNAKKDYIESEVIKICRSQITDEVIANVVKYITSLNDQDQEGLELSRLKKDIRNIEAKIDRLLNQIEEGNSSPKVAERLKQREEELELLKRQYRLEYSKQIHIEPDHARRFLKGLRHGDPNDLEYRKLLVKVFVDKVFLFDDHFRILLNYSGKASQAGNETIQGLEHYFDVECSKSSLCSPPKRLK